LARKRDAEGLGSDDLDAVWEAIEARKRRPEERLRRAMRDVFLAQAERVASALGDGDFSVPQRRDLEVITRDEVLTADAIFDLQEALTETLDAAQEGLQEALRVGFETGGLRINEELTHDPQAPWVRRKLRRLNRQMRDVPQNTRQVINETIRQGQEDTSKSVDDIADDIVGRMRRMASGTGGPDQSGSVTRSRSKRIAATSTTTAFESAQDEAWQETGVEGSSWLSQRDSRVSEGHFEADEQRRPLNEPFRVRRTFDRPFEELMHPGDPEGSASNVVNCRCTRRPLRDLDTE